MGHAKHLIADLFREDNTSLPSRLIDGVIIITILITVTSIILESEPELHDDFKPTFVALEYISLGIFSLEYLLRLWVAPLNQRYKHLSPAAARLHYMRSFHAIIDLLAIAPLILSFFAIDLRFLRVIRLLRIFKLTRYNSAMNTLLTVIKSESKAFFSVFFVFNIIIIIASSCIYLLEHEEQPEVFGSILDSMWWSIVTLATVGYGDAVPITPLGKIFGGIIMTVGIGLVALPAGLLASAFSEQLHKNKHHYRSAVKRALSDGIISPEEHRWLRELQEKYDIPESDAEEMIQEQLYKMAIRAKATHDSHCPHCGKMLKYQNPQHSDNQKTVPNK